MIEKIIADINKEYVSLLRKELAWLYADISVDDQLLIESKLTKINEDTLTTLVTTLIQNQLIHEQIVEDTFTKVLRPSIN